MKDQARSMQAVDLQQDIENIDIRIQSMVGDKAFAKPEQKHDLHEQISQLMEEKRELLRKLSKMQHQKLHSVESRYLFKGEDISHTKKHTRAMYLKVLDRVSDDLNRLETKARTHKSMMGQDMRVRLHELKSMREKLSLMTKRMSKVNADKFSDMQVDFQDILLQFEEQYDYINRQF